MRMIPVNEAKDSFSALLQAVAAGEEVVITRHGKKIARVIRESDAQPSETEKGRLRDEAIQRLRAFQAQIAPDANYVAGDWKAYRDDARR